VFRGAKWRGGSYESFDQRKSNGGSAKKRLRRRNLIPDKKEEELEETRTEIMKGSCVHSERRTEKRKERRGGRDPIRVTDQHKGIQRKKKKLQGRWEASLKNLRGETFGP